MAQDSFKNIDVDLDNYKDPNFNKNIEVNCNKDVGCGCGEISSNT